MTQQFTEDQRKLSDKKKLREYIENSTLSTKAKFQLVLSVWDQEFDIDLENKFADFKINSLIEYLCMLIPDGGLQLQLPPNETEHYHE